ncbi:mucin-binding protein [Gemella haemolysans]|uniref:mucin-binding protein n=1 Tax=Gemella haemolysans TaxID=1379 RepID=UPI0019562524|nr:MucBP domain-containing protein [Gemella haemolysans]VTX78150.1 MucBP domain protein [Gemella haemolysans]
MLADNELSKEIEKQIDGDQDKLGKGGYFSTGDIPLGKDVVSYKVQVFAENEKRVGVNKQSPRLQYNLPILADFSVIQDTVEPSKEVARRIISKSNLPEDKKKKIIEEIEKSKKTSELRSAMSGNVKVKYQTVGGTVLTLKNTVKGQKETDIGKKDTDGTYIAQKDQLLGTDYDVTGKKLATLTAADGKRYRLKRSLEDNSLEDGRLRTSASDTGTMTSTEARTVTYVYEEDNTPPAPVEVDVTRTVKRTITYVKEDNVNGAIIRTTLEERKKENTVEFTGKEVTDTANDTVSYKDWTSTNSKFPKVDTPVLEGYIANKASIEEEEATAPSSTGGVTNITREVVYTKLGSWVPNLPEGVTPPKGIDMTPKPYPNNPNDPTKPTNPVYPEPGTPTDPSTPKPPVIPYVPGYTPKIPTDPTKPEDPNTNPLVPVKPVDPADPKKGYKVPNVPNDPKKNFVIEYKPNPQKILIKVVNVTTGEEVELPEEKLEFNGVSDQVVTTEDREKVDNKIASLKQRGYIVSTKNPISKTTNYDTLDDSEEREPTQVYKIVVNEPILKDKEIVPVIRTIKYVQIDVKDGKEVKTELNTEKIKTKVDKVEFSRDATTSLTTYITKFGAWDAETKELLKVDTPVLDGYFANIAFVAKNTVQPDTDSYEVTVEYRKIGAWVPRLPEGVTPPTGTDMTPKPYPNNPTDPTKPGTPVYPEPGTPTDPNTPKPPVIPYVPGYTPKTPDGNPLVPVDPEHPENGYKVPPVPETPGNDTPITYEKVPDKPKPETTGKKEVTRTIKYVDEKGNELAKPSTDKVTFKGNGSDWNAVDGDSTFDAVKSPVVKGYVLKDPAQKVVEKETVKSDAKDETITVTYTKVGSFVPKVPEGVTPKTPLTPTPYDNDPEDPTKVVTPNPDKPQDPKDPNSPKVPVIPQVPGHTPVVPKDPTKPVSPENPLVPLTPVDPNHPEKGYNVPPVPTIPGQDTPITYVKDGQQKAITSFVDSKGNVLETPITETGDSNTPLTKDGEIKATIAKLKLKGYDVETNTYPPKGTFDNDPKVDQYFKVTLTPRVKPVKPFDPTNPKDPNKPVPGQPIDPDTPVDPNNPNDPTIPRWTDELIKKLDVKKEVTRTINYVDEKGNKVSEKSTDKVTFTREAKINVVTGEITYGNWTSTDKIYDAVKSPVVKGYILKDAKQKEVASETVRPDSEDKTITVVYTKVGSFVPKVPEGVTPKTPLTPTPYDNDPKDPSKVVTPNPEKPQDPKDPNSPKVPVIPQVPGHTPVVPKDPTKPVSPENPLVPLTPVDPNHPEKGYNVPPVPTIPGQDTPITYVKDGQQKAITSFVDSKGNVLETPITETGDSNTPLTKDGEIKATIAKLKLKGYDVETNTYPPKGTFDNDPKVDQYFKVTLTPRVKPVKPFDPTNPKDPNKPVPGQPIDPDTPVDPNNPNDPTIPRWTEDLINKLETTKQVTRTINYVDEEGNKVSEPSTDKVTFTREAKINVVTGEITYGDWKAVGGDSTFDKVSSPVVKGYILKDPAQKEVAERKGITPTVANQTIEVVYKKLGSWIPRIPEGVKPPEGTDMTPKPYPNNPTDPTKPGTPTETVPHVPGHTPVVPKDPTKPVSPENPLVPLTPVDPKDPTKGYNIPPVPENPSQDIPIEYVKDGQQRAIVNFVDENGNSVAASILQTGKAGDKFTKDALVKSTISALEAKGYEVKTNEYPKEGTGVFDNDTKVDQIFTVTVRKIEVLPPTPRVIERPGGNTLVEVGVPNKDADTLNIWYTKRNNPNAPREEIVTKKDKDGTWKIEKAPEGVTVNPSTGIVSIPGNKIQPKTWIDTQTKHETKTSKIVSVIPNIHDLKEFVGTTEWIDVEGKVLKPREEGIHEKGRFDNLVWLATILEGDKITHIFGPGTPTVDKPEYKVTVWFDENGNPIKPDKPGTYESGKIPGYRFITTTTKDGVTVHKFEKITPVDPNVVPGKVTEKQQVKRLANTGETETNTGLAGLGLAMFGIALAAIKRRKDK